MGLLRHDDGEGQASCPVSELTEDLRAPETAEVSELNGREEIGEAFAQSRFSSALFRCDVVTSDGERGWFTRAFSSALTDVRFVRLYTLAGLRYSRSQSGVATSGAMQYTT